MSLTSSIIFAIIVAVVIYVLIWAGDHFDDEV